MAVEPLRPDDFVVTSVTPRPPVDAESSISQVTMDRIVAAALSPKDDTSETSLELRRPFAMDESLPTLAPAPTSFVGRWVGEVYIVDVCEVSGGRLVLSGHTADGSARRLVVLPAELGDAHVAATVREIRELSSRERVPCPRPLAQGRVEGRLWVSYAHEDGRLLGEVLERRRLSERQAAALALELVEMAIDALSIDTALGAPFAGREWPLTPDAVVLLSDGRLATQTLWAGTFAAEASPSGEGPLRAQLDVWLARVAQAAPPGALGPLVRPSPGAPISLGQLRGQLTRRLVQLRSRRPSPPPAVPADGAQGTARAKRARGTRALSLAMVLLISGLTAAALLGLR